MQFTNTLSNVTLAQFQETVVNAGNISGNVSFNLATGSIHKGTLTGDITDLQMGNDQTGSSFTIILSQDGTGSHTLTTDSNWLWAGGNKTLSTAPNSVDVISGFWDGTNYYASLTTGYVT